MSRFGTLLSYQALGSFGIDDRNSSLIRYINTKCEEIIVNFDFTVYNY
jgi:hypothetical protein